MSQNALHFILETIDQYNAKQSADEAIKFLHPGTSAELSWVGKTVTVFKPKASEILTIPYELMPLSFLRKSYGIAPVLENNQKIFGSLADKNGIESCLKLIRKFSERRQAQLDRLIVQTIVGINVSNYIRSLKKILLYVTNLMLLDDKPREKTKPYLDAIHYEYTVLEKKITDPLKKEYLRKKFSHYVARIENVLMGNALPFVPDNKFREEILSRFPAIYCAKHMPLEKKSIKELNTPTLLLDSIKVIFVPTKYTKALRSKLKDLDRESIEVYGFEDADNCSISFSDKAIVLMQMKTLRDFIQHWDKYEKELDRRLLVEKFNHLLASIFHQHDPENYLIAAWIIKNAHSTHLEEIKSYLQKHSSYKLCESLQNKSLENSGYLKHVSDLFNEYYLSFSQMRALCSLIYLKDHLKDFAQLVDFDLHLSNHDLLAIFEKNLISDNKEEYLHNYLICLQHYYVLLTKALEFSSTLEENAIIQGRIASIKGKYIVLMTGFLSEYQLDQAIYGSELFLAVESAFKGKWKKIMIEEKKGVQVG